MGRHGAARLVADVAAEGRESRRLEQHVASRYAMSQVPTTLGFWA